MVKKNMNKTKIMITAFAVFASFLMLMTTTTARTIQEKTTIEIIENQQQEIINSIEKLITKIQNDQEIQKYKDQIINDRELSKIVSLIENTEEKTDKTRLTNTYITSLQKNPAYLNLIEYLKAAYTQDASCINAQTNNLADLLAKYCQENQDENTDEILIPFMPHGALFPVTPDDTTNTGSMDLTIPYTTLDGSYSLTISQSGDLVIGTQPSEDYNIIGGSDNNGFTGGSVTPADQEQAQWAGFLRNMNGEMYIPGIGWVEITEEWLDLESLLLNLLLVFWNLYFFMLLPIWYGAVFFVLGFFDIINLESILDSLGIGDAYEEFWHFLMYFPYYLLSPLNEDIPFWWWFLVPKPPEN